MEIGTILLDRYEILEKIGEGGMATVYKAKCHTLDRLVAIKALKSEYAEDEDFVKKFMMECQSAAKLNHPNIVGIYDFHEITNNDKPLYFIVMEYIDGITLKDLIAQKGKISEPEAINISLQILEALKEAHANGIVHRDIKPHNIMISKSGIIKVTDFGIARATTNHTMTTTMDAIGSVHYFSPEQARGAFTDQRTDIYSFGIVLYEMLTGVRPFVGENPITIAMKHIQEEIVPPSELNPEISDAIERVVLKCTMKKQAERYQNAEEVIMDLSAIQSGARSFYTSEDIDESLEQTRIINTVEVEDILDKKKSNIFLDDDDDDFEDTDDYYYDDDYDYDDKQKKRIVKKKSGILPVILGVILAFVISTALYVGYTKLKQGQKANEVKEVTLNNLIGMSEADARQALEELNLKMEIESETTDTTKPFGILNQKPQAGIKVKEGSTVYVVLNVDSDQERLESFVGQKIEDIENKISKMALKIEVQYVDSEEEENTIISQNPIAGSTYTEGDTIYLTVSNGKGAEEKTVPNVLGYKFELAKSTLEGEGLIVLDPEYAKSDETAKDAVISQSIQAGEKFEEGDKIKLTVSEGPEEKPEEEPEQKPNETEKPEENTETKPKTADFKVAVPLPQDVDESLIKLVKVVDGQRTTVFEQTYSKSEEVVYVSLKGEPVGEILELYINDNFAETFTVK